VKSSQISGESVRAGGWRDQAAIAVLLLVGWATRLPSLTRVALNPDESQYESTAAYMLASDLSAFEILHTSAGTYTFYKIFGRLFEPYAMLEVRIAIMLLIIGTALLIYRVVRVEGGPWSGLAAGLVVVLWSVYFEGLTANREWFCNALLVAGSVLFLGSFGRRGRSADAALLASGVLCGAALWFKLHAALLVLPIALLCVWRATYDDQRRDALRALALYVAGGLSIGVAGMLPFAFEGTLGAYADSIVTDVFGYAGATAVGGTGGNGWSFGRQFYSEVPGRSLLLAAYGFTAVTFWGMLSRLFRRDDLAWPLAARLPAELFSLYLVAAMISVTIGQRFFGHYYLFMVPPVAALCGLAIGSLNKAGERTKRVCWTAAVLLGLFAIDRLATWTGRVQPSTWVYLALLLTLVLYGLSRPRLRLAAAVAAVLGVEIVFLGVWAIPLLDPPSAPYAGHRFTELSADLIARSRADDRLFVWGWAPEIYSLTRLTPGSQFTISMYLVNDTRSDPQLAEIDPRYERRLMRELHATQPRFIVDASRRSWTMALSGEPWLYDLTRYPEFELNRYLNRHYRPVARHDGCVVYERRGGAG
jgi:4-amino-4-deoxy-L-arabinose transferase-like glycosyltransferase